MVTVFTILFCLTMAGVAAAFLAGANWKKAQDLEAVNWVRENESKDGGYICDRVEERIKGTRR